MNKRLFFYLGLFLLFSCQGPSKKLKQKIEAGVKNVDALLIVHPTTYYDEDEEAKRAINLIANEFIFQKKPVFTLVESEKDLTSHQYLNYFPKLKETSIVFSRNGENQIQLKGNRFVVVGGYFYACLRTAIIHLARHQLKNEMNQITIFLPLPAIYGKNLNLGEEDKQKIKRHGWLPKNMSLEVKIKEKVLLSLNESAPKKILVRFIEGRGFLE